MAADASRKEQKHQELNDLVTMAEACVTACAEVQGGCITRIEGILRNRYAALLSTCLTVYALSEDREQIRALAPDEISDGMFRDGGREIFFPDERRTITNLAVKRSALKAAIDRLKR